MKILTSEQMKRVEQKCAGIGVPTSTLMENAGRAVAEEVRRTVGSGFRRALVLVGPGNNGGDGEVAARYLKGWGLDVTLYMLAQRPAGDKNLSLARESGVGVIEAEDDPGIRLENALASANVIVDAVFGTGFAVRSERRGSRPLGDSVSRAFGAVRQAKQQRPDLTIFAVDVPSGLDADTGAVDEACLHADETIVLGYPKIGLFNVPGADRAGRLKIVDIGIPPGLEDDSVAELATDDWVGPLLPRRPLVSNKGTFGKVMVVAGSENYAGAAYLACSGALRSGAGLVTLAASAALRSVVASRIAEVTYLPLPESGGGPGTSEAEEVVRRSLQSYRVLLIGCGLGQSDTVARMVRSLLLGRKKSPVPCVIDADALNILSGMGHSTQVWRRLAGDAILTPHPGEMARLAAMEIDEIQQDRIGVAARSARKWQKTVVLKGAYTVTAAPDGRIVVSPFANAALASAGTGDVLAGAIAGLVAQGMPLFEAAAAGVYLHGKAGEMAGRDMGDAGVIASDILQRLPVSIREIKRANRPGG